LAGCCECGDEPSGSGATESVSVVTSYGTVGVKWDSNTLPIAWSCDLISTDSCVSAKRAAAGEGRASYFVVLFLFLPRTPVRAAVSSFVFLAGK
jgi:hypothetical protein